MNDDWRLRVDLNEEGIAHELTGRLEAFDLSHDLQTSFGDRVIVSRDGPEVFCYTGTREQAEAAERAIRAVADKHGWSLTSRLEHWHPTAEQWEAPDEPLPHTETETAAERAELMETEREESEEQDYPNSRSSALPVARGCPCAGREAEERRPAHRPAARIRRSGGGGRGQRQRPR